jgi:hypothetical protein
MKTLNCYQCKDKKMHHDAQVSHAGSSQCEYCCNALQVHKVVKPSVCSPLVVRL